MEFIILELVEEIFDRVRSHTASVIQSSSAKLQCCIRANRMHLAKIAGRYEFCPCGFLFQRSFSPDGINGGIDEEF
jgi:hypothetical protein